MKHSGGFSMSDRLALPIIQQSGSLEGYMSAVGSIAVLTADEERDLSIRFREQNDLDAARALVMAHLRFVVHIARGYGGYGLPLADLIQEGNIGLMKAVKRFDPEHNVRLVSFAVHWIRAEIHEYVLRNWRIVKVATTKAQRKLFFNLRKSKARLGWLNQAEVEAVASDLGVPPREVMEMESRLSGRDVAFDAPTDADEEQTFSPAAYLEDHGQDPALHVELADNEAYHTNLLRQGLADLNERSRTIIQRRWLDEEKATLQDLADIYGVSVERIRQVEAQALKKLRCAFEA
jgi:RNA polymerase sigma-32 factor